MNVEKTKVMRISRQPSPVTIMIEQKQLENVECFKYLGSILTLRTVRPIYRTGTPLPSKHPILYFFFNKYTY